MQSKIVLKIQNKNKTTAKSRRKRGKKEKVKRGKKIMKWQSHTTNKIKSVKPAPYLTNKRL